MLQQQCAAVGRLNADQYQLAASAPDRDRPVGFATGRRGVGAGLHGVPITSTQSGSCPRMSLPNSSRSSAWGKLVRQSKPTRRCALLAMRGRTSSAYAEPSDAARPSRVAACNRGPRQPSQKLSLSWSPKIVARCYAIAEFLATHFQCLVAQAVSFIEQQQAFALEFTLRDNRLIAQRVPGGTGKAERLQEQRHRPIAFGVLGQRDQHTSSA